MQKTDENPWVAMLSNPSTTIRSIIKTNPRSGFFYLSSIWFLQLFFLCISYLSLSFPIHYGLTILIAVILSPFLGAICLQVFSYFLYISGKCLKGKSKFIQIRCAFAWSRLPFVINLFMWFVLSIFLAELLFVRVGISYTFYSTTLITSITSVWAFALLVLSVKEVQGFSLIRSLISVILAYLFIILILLGISLVYYQFI